MNKLLGRILDLDPELRWSSSEADDKKGAENHFKNYISQILSILIEETKANRAYMTLSSIDSGKFIPFARIGEENSIIKAIPTFGSGSLILKHIWKKEIVSIIDSPSADPDYIGDKRISQKVLIRLYGHGELFGYISLDWFSGRKIDPHIYEQLKNSINELIWRIAEQNFTMRVHELAGPLNPLNATIDISEVYKYIINLIVKGFAPDGVVIRLYNDKKRVLEVVDFQGEINENLLIDRELNSGICGKIFINNMSWAMVINAKGIFNMNLNYGVDEEDYKRMKELGIHSFMVRKLESYLDENNKENIGTISIFYNRPHCFSWRDVALFRSFCQRVSDTIALYNQTNKLLKSNESLRVQSRMLTEVEIVSLIAHDLWHKSFHVNLDLDTLIKHVQSSLKRKIKPTLYEEIEQQAYKALSESEKVHAAIEQVRKLHSTKENFEKCSYFFLNSVIKEIEETLSGALDRNKVTIIRKSSLDIKIYGPRVVLVQIFFNLIINSIEAGKSRKSRRPMMIYIRAEYEKHKDNRNLNIYIWDDGPGIHRKIFSDPNEIFEIGSTTRDTGTGTGLPIARMLLTRYYKGNLQLIDSSTARFRIFIPLVKGDKSNE